MSSADGATSGTPAAPPAATNAAQPSFVEFRQVAKRFGGVTALSGISLHIREGECHALIGENGAGKSTLGRLLAGIHRPDSGQLFVAGQRCEFRSPADAARRGISMVHQELAFCPDLSVAENLNLGRYPRHWGGFVHKRALATRAAALLEQVGAVLDVARPMRELSTGHEQLVQIASAVGSGARILVFDEPTSSLSMTETERLFELISRLRARGVTVVYISHRLAEVFRLADRISVLRDGQLVGTVARQEASQDLLVRLMIGRPLEQYFPRHLAADCGPETLVVEGLSSPGKLAGVSFAVHAGEIVGMAGLVGSGRSDVARAIFGLDRAASGRVRVGDRVLKLRSVRGALRLGVGLIPEDRKRQGLVLGMGGRQNFSLAQLDQLQRCGWLARRRERQAASMFFERLGIRTPSLDSPVVGLSGGNQQKVVVAKWLARTLRVLILDEPTRGVDVATKAALHGLIDELARQGLAVLLISSELPELLSLSRRILVMRAGRLVGELARDAATQERLLGLMAGLADSTK